MAQELLRISDPKTTTGISVQSVRAVGDIRNGGGNGGDPGQPIKIAANLATANKLRHILSNINSKPNLSDQAKSAVEFKLLPTIGQLDPAGGGVAVGGGCGSSDNGGAIAVAQGVLEAVPETQEEDREVLEFLN